MTTMADPDWSTDLTALCERLAERRRSEGAPHPEVAAVAHAVRGAAGVDQPTFAAQTGVAVDELLAIEAGERAWAELPAALVDAVRSTAGVDLERLGID